MAFACFQFAAKVNLLIRKKKKGDPKIESTDVLKNWTAFIKLFSMS